VVPPAGYAHDFGGVKGADRLRRRNVAVSALTCRTPQPPSPRIHPEILLGNQGRKTRPRTRQGEVVEETRRNRDNGDRKCGDEARDGRVDDVAAAELTARAAAACDNLADAFKLVG
jgi:hypothetical protein